MADILRFQKPGDSEAKEYEFPARARAEVLEDCEAEVLAFLDIPNRPNLIPLGAQAKAIRVLVHRVLSAKYPDLKVEDVSLSPLEMFQAIPMLVRVLGLGFKDINGSPGEGGGPPSM